MMNRNTRKAIVAFSLPATMLALGLLGCQSEDPQAKVDATPPPPPPPAAPAVASIESLMAELNIDPRVMLPEDKAPATTAERKAVLELFDGFARGDSEVVSSYVSYSDRPLLQDLVTSGRWKQTTDSIMQIRLDTGITPQGDPCVLAIIQTSTEYQPQMWQYSPGTETAYTFDSVYTPPDMMNKLSGTDWITEWYKIVEAEMLLAQVPDEELAPAQRILDENGEEVSAGEMPSGGGSPGRGPARAPGGPTGPAVAPGRGPNSPGKR